MLKSVRDCKTASILTPVFIEIAIIGVMVIIVATLSLLFGVSSGKLAAKASSLVTRLTTDVTNVQQAYMMVIRAVVRALITILFSIIISFIIDVRIGIINLVATTILEFLLIFIANYDLYMFNTNFLLWSKIYSCSFPNNMRTYKYIFLYYASVK